MNPFFYSDLQVRIELKTRILDEMHRLHPEENFWVSQRERLIGEAISNRQGFEFSLSELEGKANDLAARGKSCPYYKQMRRYFETFFLTDGKYFELAT
ncbi:hypothetical protein [Proteus mirabilis]|uniref:hypothetical protein n=1 Tax=Proteus mirabilis TaxID=584 RepID=UPI0015C54ED9|nr:hypothetical protein [Proteus mirabilis]